MCVLSKGCFHVDLSPQALVKNTFSFMEVYELKVTLVKTERERSHFVKPSLTVQILGLTRGLELGQNSKSSQVSPCLNCFFVVFSNMAFGAQNGMQ